MSDATVSVLGKELAMLSQDSVEFIGGPYDGYQHQLSSMPSGIFEQAALPVSANLIRACDGRKPWAALTVSKSRDL